MEESFVAVFTIAAADDPVVVASADSEYIDLQPHPQIVIIGVSNFRLLVAVVAIAFAALLLMLLL